MSDFTRGERLDYFVSKFNQFFTDLAGHARTHPDTELTRWWPSSRCQQPDAFRELEAGAAIPSRVYAATVAADGHGIWNPHPNDPTDGQTGGQVHVEFGGRPVRVPFFAEIDLGTEDLTRVAGKVAAYERFSRACGRSAGVLLARLARAERHLQTRLAEQDTSSGRHRHPRPRRPLRAQSGR
jgi:hypothetical protein